MSTWSPDPTWHNRVTQSALRSGINPEVLIGLARAESGLRNIPTGITAPDGSPASRAFGPWQFVPDTWAGVIRNNPDAGLTPEGRLDPNMQAEAAPLLASEIISGLGVEDPTATDLYMGWAYGPRGQAMARAARSNPGAPASEFVDPQWITQHGFAADATVGEVFEGTGRALAERAGIDPRAPATAKDGMEKMTTAAGMPPMATRDVGRAPGVLAPGEAPPALPGLLSDGPAPSASGAPRAESGGLLDGLLGLLGGGEDPGRDDVFGGLLGNGESNLPMLMVGLQILQNAGPSLEPQSMFAGVQEAAAGGMRMQQFQDQRRGQADRQAMLERLTAADPALAALARLDPEGVSRALVERGFATADGGEIREVGGRLVRVMQDGTVEEIYAAPDAGTPDTENARQIEALMARGLSRSDAENIAYGFARLTQNPVTGDTSIVDLTTGEGRLVDFAPGEELGAAGGSEPTPSDQPTLWELAPLTTGPESAAGAAASRTIGNIPGFEDVGSQTTAARQFVNAAQNDLVRALSINPRFPVAEIERIRREIDIAPALIDSPASLRSRMVAIDRYLRGRMESELSAAQDPTLTVQDRGAAARAARDIGNFLGRLGVPDAPDASGSAEGAPEVSPASSASRPAPPPGFVRD